MCDTPATATIKEGPVNPNETKKQAQDRKEFNFGRALINPMATQGEVGETDATDSLLTAGAAKALKVKTGFGRKSTFLTEPNGGK